MKLLIGLVTGLFFTMLNAAEGKHAIAIGAGGFGLSSNYEKFSSRFLFISETKNSLPLNYAYYFDSGFILGANINSTTYESKYSGEIHKSRSNEFLVNLGYNLNNDFYNSWWVIGSLGYGTYKSETTYSPTLVSASSSYSASAHHTTLGFSIGKRFDLKFMRIQQISYAPSVGLSAFKYGGEIFGHIKSHTIKIEPIRFELLF